MDAVTFDGSILWLKQSGVTVRRLVESIAGMYLSHQQLRRRLSPAIAATKRKSWLALKRLLF